MSSYRTAAILWVLTLTAVAVAPAPNAYSQELAPAGVEYPIDHSFRHMPTGVILPTDVAGLQLGSVYYFQDRGAGVSLHYRSPSGVAADLYIYNAGMNKIEEDSQHLALAGQLDASVREVKQIADYGIYTNVDVGNQPKLESYSAGGEEITFLSMPLSYRRIQNAATGSPNDGILLRSLISVASYKDYFFKIRYTFEATEEEVATDRLREVREEFLGDVARLILDTQLRPWIQESLGTYLKAPLGPEGREASELLMAYAKSSRLIQIAVDMRLMPWFEVENYPYNSELLSAFVAGNLSRQFSHGEFGPQSYHGLRQVFAVYQELRDKRAAPEVPGLEKLMALDRERRLQQYLHQIIDLGLVGE